MVHMEMYKKYKKQTQTKPKTNANGVGSVLKATRHTYSLLTFLFLQIISFFDFPLIDIRWITSN